MASRIPNPESAPPGDAPLPETPAVPATRAQRSLVFCFLVLIASVPLLQITVELAQRDPVQALAVFQQRPTAANLRAFEHDLEDANAVARFLRPWMQSALFAGLKDGGEKVLIGRDGWLFYKPGVDYVAGRPPPVSAAGKAADPLPAIVAFRDDLAARNIRLLLLPVPNKESVYPDQLSRRAEGLSGVTGAATRHLMTRLQAAGVEVVDLFGEFGQARQQKSPASPPLYLATDTHWSPAGVDLAARTVARRLRELGWVRPGEVAYESRPATVERGGDLLRMLRVPWLEARAKPERVDCLQVVRTADGQPYRDDPRAPVLVLGDSFLRIYEKDEPGAAGFIAHLSRELRQPVASLVSDGGASTLVRQDLHGRPALLQNKRVVIWEFVERDIMLGVEGWQVIRQ